MTDRHQGGEGAAEPGVVETLNPDGAGPFVLACEHASNAIPAEFSDLGLDAEALASHVAWDPGAHAVALHLSALLDAPLVASRISRLVYDCNRPPHAPDATPARSEAYTIPGNAGLTRAARMRRAERFYFPFRAALSACLDSRMQAGKAPALVTVHSFTPVYLGRRRAVEIGILHDRDRRLADALIASLAQEGGWIVRRNEPYGPQDGVTHTLADQALGRGLDNVMIEIRNDLIAGAAEQKAMADLLARHLKMALAALKGETLAK
ncbi:N-formylglutamate amidohydrolase [Chelativorans intermedius]|uniref:N-formylglutamate amidohydrolase n=1 Tax=Chelativorans intermedius TaxID=515947 RepID=A0ABV6D4D6_9HYPH|nr:N-formylglutamate amidohydrolase [Chelativorans intermedius]MCT8997605.1 N-formylglutamate amidohydrolase [Chelativorans intermedius]